MTVTDGQMQADQEDRSGGGRSAVDLEGAARLRLVVLRLARRLRQHSGDPITPSQLSVLATVERDGPLSAGALAALERVRPPSVTRIVDGLEEMGLVDRRPSPTDRRSAVVTITARGRRRLARIRSNRDAWLAQRLAQLSAPERATLDRALPALERLLEEEA